MTARSITFATMERSSSRTPRSVGEEVTAQPRPSMKARASAVVTGMSAGTDTSNHGSAAVLAPAAASAASEGVTIMGNVRLPMP